MINHPLHFNPEKISEYKERFETYIDKSADCWEWKGVIMPNGYGINTVQARKLGKVAHRVSYQLHIGEIPKGLFIDHLCRNRRCVNPNHLEPVTPKENQHRSPLTSATKTHCPQGHEYTVENIYRRPDKKNYRGCKACIKLSTKRYYEKTRSTSCR